MHDRKGEFEQKQLEGLGAWAAGMAVERRQIQEVL